MPVGLSKAERLAFKLRTRCMRELITKGSGAGSTYFKIHSVDRSYLVQGGWEFVVEERLISKTGYSSKAVWSMLIRDLDNDSSVPNFNG